MEFLNSTALLIYMFSSPTTNVTEPPLLCAATEVGGPGADSGSDQIGSAPDPGKKMTALGGSSSIHYFFSF